MGIGAFDDLERPFARGGDEAGCLRALIAGIGEDALDEGKALAGAAEEDTDAVAVLNVGGVDLDAQQEAERIDENVPLAPGNLLAGVVALRIPRPPLWNGPPLSSTLSGLGNRRTR